MKATAWLGGKRKKSMWPVMILALSLILGIGLVGGSFGQWSASIFVVKEVATGNLNVELSGAESPNMSVAINRADSKDNHQLYFTLASVEQNDHFVCTFEITNTGTIPIKFEDPVVTNIDNYYCDISERWQKAMVIRFDMPDSIDPQKTAIGSITILNNSSGITGTYTFQSYVPCVQWNGYRFGDNWWHDQLYFDGQMTVISHSE